MPDQAKETTMPVSTRFEPGELEVLKQAAAIKQWSVAQLVRLGAYEKAVSILNASGERFYTARRFVVPVVKQLLDADLRGPDGTSFGRELYEETVMELHAQVMEYGVVEPVHVSALGQDQFDGFLRAVRALGPELASILEDESKRVLTGAKNFPDLIDPSPAASSQPVGVAAGLSKPETEALARPPSQPKRRGRGRPTRKEK